MSVDASREAHRIVEVNALEYAETLRLARIGAAVSMRRQWALDEGGDGDAVRVCNDIVAIAAGRVCTGAYDCPAAVHIHGCYADFPAAPPTEEEAP